jgi:putative exosortase-associated protein (TIGR04073 family)
MKHITGFITAVSMLLGAATFVAAQTVMTIRGAVVAVDPQASTIQVRDESQGKMFIVRVPQEQSQILVSPDGKQVALAEIQVGQIIEIRHQESGGRQVVQQIQVLPAPAPTPVAAPVAIPAPVAAPVSTQVAVTAPATVPVTPAPQRLDTAMTVQTPAAPAPATTTRFDPATGTTTVVSSSTVIMPSAAPMVEEPRWNMGDKLLRGVGNLLFGFVELPRSIFNTSQKNILAGLTLGPIQGIGYTIVRMGAGAYDLLTFPIPVPGRYRPLVQPEFPWQETAPTRGFSVN